MSKKINFGTIAKKELETMSTYNATVRALDALTKEYRQNKKLIEERIEKILQERKEALENGMSVDEVTRNFSTTEENNKVRELTEKYFAKKKPLTDKITECLAIVPDNTYEAYKKAMKDGEMSVLTQSVNLFLKNIGVNTPEKATSKFAQIMSIRISGMRKATVKDKKEGHFVSAKAQREFKEMFILAFLEYVVYEKKVVDMDENGILSMHVFED